VPPVAVRLRRDFEALLNLIRAHAVLHRATRETDQDGRVVATVEDYARVRELVADLVSEGVEAAVPPTEGSSGEAGPWRSVAGGRRDPARSRAVAGLHGCRRAGGG
jgi:hypothetical protein